MKIDDQSRTTTTRTASRAKVSSRYKIGGDLAGPLQIFTLTFTLHHDLETQFISETILWTAIL